MATSKLERIIGKAISPNIKYGWFSNTAAGARIEIKSYTAYYGFVVLIIGRYKTSAYHIEGMASGAILTATKLFGEDMDVSDISSGYIRTTALSTKTYDAWMVLLISPNSEPVQRTTITLLPPT